MIRYLMKKFALSRQGAVDFIWAVIACAVSDLSFMFPVSLLYFLVIDFLEGAVETSHAIGYGVGIALSLILIFLTSLWKYNATYFATYKESGVRRIRLAENSENCLWLFRKKDLADLTHTIMGDCATLEQMMSHYVPQFYGSVLSTCLIACNLFFFEGRLALSALWVLPVALIIVGASKKAQNAFSRKQSQAQIVMEEGIQENLETLRDLKSNNAEKDHLNDLFGKIDAVEKGISKTNWDRRCSSFRRR